MQLSMDLEPPRPNWPAKTREHGANNMFFAILPEPDAAGDSEKLGARLRTHYGLSGRPISAKQLHITLNPIANYAKPLEYDVSAAMQAAATIEAAPFEVTFNRVQSFRGGEQAPLVMRCAEGVAPLTKLQKALLAALKTTGYVPQGSSSFTPHITLLYDRKSIDETMLETADRLDGARIRPRLQRIW